VTASDLAFLSAVRRAIRQHRAYELHRSMLEPLRQMIEHELQDRRAKRCTESIRPASGEGATVLNSHRVRAPDGE
jgi:hypothetical protein